MYGQMTTQVTIQYILFLCKSTRFLMGMEYIILVLVLLMGFERNFQICVYIRNKCILMQRCSEKFNRSQQNIDLVKFADSIRDLYY